jgi:hypothetical protein
VNAVQRDTLILRYLDRAAARGRTGRQQVIAALDAGGRGSVYATVPPDDAALERETTQLRDGKAALDADPALRSLVTQHQDDAGALDTALQKSGYGGIDGAQQRMLVRVVAAGF